MESRSVVAYEQGRDGSGEVEITRRCKETFGADEYINNLDCVYIYIYIIYLGLSELRKMYILNMYNLSFVHCNNSVNMEEKLQKHL